MTGARDLLEEPRDHARADDEHEHAEERDLRERDGEPEREVVTAASTDTAEDRSEGRKEDEHEHDRKVLDHDPAHSDLSMR